MCNFGALGDLEVHGYIADLPQGILGVDFLARHRLKVNVADACLEGDTEEQRYVGTIR